MSTNDKGLQFDKDNNVSFYFSDFCRGLKKFWWIIAIVCILCCAFNVFRCHRSYTPMYKAEATFTISTQDKTASLNGIASYNFYYDASTATHLSKASAEETPSIMISPQICILMKLQCSQKLLLHY